MKIIIKNESGNETYLEAIVSTKEGNALVTIINAMCGEIIE